MDARSRFMPIELVRGQKESASTASRLCNEREEEPIVGRSARADTWIRDNRGRKEAWAKEKSVRRGGNERGEARERTGWRNDFFTE